LLIIFAKTPPKVYIPKLNGVTSTNTTLDIYYPPYPANIPACTAAPYATA